jgi:hypothetical protein
MVITLTKKIREDTEITQKSAEFALFCRLKAKKSALFFAAG